ncbi:EF-hand domain-containing protein [Salinisphaera sp. T31B1]|uniref:EF-hand domain-containing protein n=1 Tax=Salinisphaera sp. T31B1 TaxID=727963 RepID=UPI00333FAC37
MSSILFPGVRTAIVMGLIGAAAPVHAADSGDSGLAALDANDDHVISRQEAANGQVAAFRSIDADGNGVLDRGELAASRPSTAEADDRAVRRARQAALDRWFANLDADDSGDISLAEYQAAMTPYFDRLDDNGDGVIDGAELREAYGEPDASAAKSR